MRYTEVFTPDRGKSSVDAVVARLKKGKSADIELAEFLRERAKIEETYSQQLARLCKRTLSQEARDGLGTFTALVESMVAADYEISAAHLQLSRSIMSQVELSVKETRPTDDVLKQEPTVAKGAKSFEEKSAALRKAKDKVARKAGSKNEAELGKATAAFEQSRTDWNRELTTFLDRAQNAEEARLKKLKDGLNNWATLEAETYRKAAAACDKALVNIVSSEVSSEIDEFCAKNAGQAGSPMAEAGSRSGSSFPQFSGFGFKSLTRATSLLSIGSKNSEDKKQPTSSPAEPGTTGFDGPPAVSTPVNYGNDEVTVDEEGYRVVVHKDPFASSSAGRNFEDDDDDVEGSHQAHQPKFKVEIKEQAIVDGSEDLATAMSNMAEKMKTGSNMRRISIARQPTSSSINETETVEAPGSPEQRLDEGDVPNSPALEPAPAQSDAQAIVPANALEAVPADTLEPVPADTLEASPLATNTATEPVHLKLKLFVTETVNAVISSSGEVSKMLIVGEVGLALDGSLPSAALPQQTRFNLFFKDDDAIEKVVANATYCADAEDSARCFPCNLGSIISYAPSETSLLPLLKYQVRVQDSELDKFAPLGIRTRWKADSSQTSLMLLYQYPGEALGSLPLTGVDVLVSLAGTADVASVQCKPNGPWNKDRRMLLWRLGDVQPTGEEPGKLMARFDTGASPIVGDGATSPGDSSAAQLPPGPINVRFSCNGALLSRTELGAALADGNEVLATVEVTEVRKQVVAGKYVVLP